jgi:hypothetical protein
VAELVEDECQARGATRRHQGRVFYDFRRMLFFQPHLLPVTPDAACGAKPRRRHHVSRSTS